MGISDEDADDVEDEDEVVEEPPRKRNKLQATLSFGGKVLGGKATKSKRQGSENAKKEGARNADAFTYKAGIKESLPPMHDIVDIFDDLTKNAVRLGLKDAVEHLGSHKLRVATMCSGTESPILALDLIGESLQKLFGLKFRVDHQFSAEIVPYKQAYIERNFAPPLIFRDIRELIDSTTATTAYGAVADVPGDIDLLVAGFSCVDFSNLNTKKQTLDAGGESGDTFRSVFNYAKTWRPALIILENVCSAPWEKLREAWAGADYDARFFKLDTKHYYIPHTRQRGYMVCIDREKLKASGKAAERWTELVQSLKRPASSSIEAFLLHEDDPRVHRGRAEMSRRDHGEDKGPREVDWTKCQGRHQDYRADLFLGSKRPMTGWEDNGSARMPDYAWGDWGAQQVERIWDTFEISFLRNVRRGFDSSYKTNKQLQDLAGNAMTSTVVGAAMMAALTVGHKAIKISDDKDPDVMDIDSKEDVSKHLCGEEHLHTQPLDLGHVEDRPIDAVLADAARSARLCLCEGRALMTSNRLRRCKLCHHTTCEECGGTPSHAYEVISSREIKLRIAPGAFEDQLKNALPMRVMLAGIAANSLEALKDKSGVSVDRKDWSLFKSAITPALGVDFRFHSLKRAGSWTAYYDSPTSRMELALNTRQAEWRIFAKPDPMEPGNSRVRDLLLRPFARMKPAGKSLIEGEWQICLPVLHTFRVKIQGLGSLQRSWESKQGWKKGDWVEVTKLNEGTVYASFAWLTERVRVIHGLDVWKPLALDDKASSCRLCAPTAPQVRWKVEKQKLIPYEDSTQAAPYEHALKNRPPPFVTQVRIDDDNVGMLRIGLNVWSLVHRSIASLPKKGPEIDAAVSWRLSTNYVPPPRVVLPQLTLRSNKNDRPSRQPPNFLLKLRPEQLRSVHWMISQEAEDVAPFVEEEVEEALLPQLGWRAEARATKAVTSRGGVLADQVGYGKTATTLGLIDIQFEKEKANPLPSLKGKIAIKASLIIVPNTLVDQWRNEVLKFLGRGYNVVCVKTQIALAALTIKDFQNADIIITTWPIFNNETYLGKLASLAALPEMPSTSGRAFDAWYAYALTRVQGHVDVLREDGASTLREVLKATLDSTERDDELSSHVPSKRLRGAAYQAAKAGGKENDKPGNKRGQADRKSSTKGPKTAPKGGVDPFSLSGKAARGRWTEMKCPLFQMFHFNRVVVDEYTYVAGKDHTCTVNLSANARWVLSGTPPLEDFADIKSISVFLGINLGVDDDAAGFIKAKTIKTMQKERTAVEKFQAFKTVRSPAWHERRHEVAQLFLDQFVRQNIAEIDEIPFKEHLRPVVLPAAERAIYLELHSHLMSQDMKIRQGKTRADSDRVKRLTETLGASKTAEEALLKRCSHFTLEDLTSKRENAKQACDLVVVERRRQLAELEAELQKNLRHAAWLKFVCGDSDKHYDGWKKNVSGNTFGDKPATEALIKYINTAEAESKPRDEDEFYKKTGLVPGPEQKKAALQAKKVKAKKALERKRAAKKRAFDSDESEAIETEEDDEEENQDLRAIKLVTPSQHVQALRDLAGQLRRLATELIARRRSLRFFKVVRELQLEYSALRRGDAEAKTFGCPVCGKDGFPPSELAVLTICGHTACPGCDPRKENNDACSVDGCNAAARGFSIVRAAELGEEDLNARVGRHYGKKLQEVVHLIGAEIPEDEQVLLFVQYDDLMEKVSQALTDNGISNIALTDRNKKYSSALMSSFQSERGHDKKKVLVLNVANESASGANLTNANHIIFLSPFLLGSQYHYDASTTQAIGRARRYGQKKLVHIYRFLSLKTIDVDILESRTKKKLEKVGDGFELVERSSGEDGKEGEGKAETWGGGLLKNQSLGDD
ncbi:MAG: hypothetical protein M1832_003758 [Thelocarpon impressellum]|nr:MAG: hypothetical protein M1832_003758 [Thelocarpon impressellum]